MPEQGIIMLWHGRLSARRSWPTLGRKKNLVATQNIGTAMNWKVMLSAVLALALGGCGGGSSSSGATCASFVYQEDAQANYTKALDRDNDGIACEDLPHRPIATTTPGLPPTPALPAPSVTQTLEFADTLARTPITQRLSDGTFSFSVNAFINPVGTSTGTASVDGNSVVILGSTGFRYFEAIPGVFLSNFQQGVTASQAVSYAAAAALPLASIAGDYVFLGRRCVSDIGDNCDLVYGNARIQADGTFGFCPSSNYSQTCVSKIEAKISTPANAAGKFVFYPTASLFGGIRTGSVGANGVSVQIENGGVIYALFGQLTSYTAQVGSGVYTSSGIDNSGFYRRTSLGTVLQNTPLPYFSSDASGRIYIRSLSGLSVTGTPRVNGGSATLNFSVAK